jgi:hypothetical protein
LLEAVVVLDSGGFDQDASNDGHESTVVAKRAPSARSGVSGNDAE